MYKFDSEAIERYNKSSWEKYTEFTIVVMTICCVVGIVFIFLMQFFFVFPVVDGLSMYPTLKDEQSVMAIKTNNFKRDDIVVLSAIKEIGEDRLIKRVVGIDGDTIICLNNVVKRVTQSGEETILAERFVGIWNFSETSFVVPKGKIFIMGDNYNISNDSTEVGVVDESHVQARLLKKYERVKI